MSKWTFLISLTLGAALGWCYVFVHWYIKKRDFYWTWLLVKPMPLTDQEYERLISFYDPSFRKNMKTCQEVADEIQAEMLSVSPTDEKLHGVDFCLEDLRQTYYGLTPLIQWCKLLKKLEGRRVVSVTLSDANHPYLKRLSVLTEK